MEIHFKSSRGKEGEMEIPASATQIAERKIRTLKKYIKETQGVAQVYVELGKVTEAHQSGKIWRSQINIDSGGRRYHADATADTIENAIDAMMIEVEAELRKAKEKRKSMIRKGGGMLKSFMRGFSSR